MRRRPSSVAKAARRELDQLLAGTGLPEPVRPEAEALLAEQGIPLPPQERLVGRLCRCLVSLADAEVPKAAADLAHALAVALRDDDLLAVSYSLR